MNEKLFGQERFNLLNELNSIMFVPKRTEVIEETRKKYDRAGEIMVKLGLLGVEHQHFPEVVARTYAHYIANKIKTLNKDNHGCQLDMCVKNNLDTNSKLYKNEN